MNKRQFILNKIKRKIKKIFSKRKTYILLSYFIIIAILFFILYQPITHSSIFNKEKNFPPTQQVYSGGEERMGEGVYIASLPVTYSEIPNILTGQAMIQDLPKDTTILLKFYNFNTGERQWENSYLLTRGNVIEGDTNSYDLFLYIHSKYLQTFRYNGLCETIQTANNNGDLGVETELSDIALAWKFKSILEYKDCFGI